MNSDQETKVAAVLAGHGFNRIEPVYDRQGPDFFAYHKDSGRMLKVKLETRAHIARRHIGKDLWMVFPARESWYLVPHDDLMAIFEEEAIRGKPLKSRSWLNDGIYNFPNLPQKMLERLKEYRLSDAKETGGNATKMRQSINQSVSAPNLGSDALVLGAIAVRHCRFPHPEVVSRLHGAVFPVIRDTQKRSQVETVDGRRIMYDDNTTPRWALLWSHGFETTAHCKGWTFAHVWNESKNPDAYTHVANLVMMPECLASLSDKDGPLVPFLRYHAETVYGWRPQGKPEVGKPSGYDDLEWNYFEPVPDPRGHIRARLARSNAGRAKCLRDLLGW